MRLTEKQMEKSLRLKVRAETLKEVGEWLAIKTATSTWGSELIIIPYLWVEAFKKGEMPKD